mmetsp:Transcript_7013/g.6198  ORF Transcript_7013/g.6198 Transcript_7013/m.6198 type:complete len:80 (-) Transcript_7013:1103-1342(-)
MNKKELDYSKRIRLIEGMIDLISIPEEDPNDIEHKNLDRVKFPYKIKVVKAGLTLVQNFISQSPYAAELVDKSILYKHI